MREGAGVILKGKMERENVPRWQETEHDVVKCKSFLKPEQWGNEGQCTVCLVGVAKMQ